MLKRFGMLFQLLLTALFAAALAISIQYVSVKPYHLSFMYWLNQHLDLYAFSGGILFFIMLGFGALVNNLYLSCFVFSVLIGTLDYAQYHKLQILGEPIYPWDLNQLKNMTEMLKIVQNFISPVLLISAAALFVLAIAVTFLIPRKHLKLPLRAAFMTTGVLVIFCCTHLQDSVLAAPLEKLGAADYHWNQQQNYLENGFVVAFLDNIGLKMENQPADYNQAAMQAIVQKYTNSPAAATANAPAEQPNIVYVMDESLFDPTRLNNVSFTEDPMANIHQYAGTYATGYSLSPVFGGGTSNVEFEALTGLNMSFMNEGSVPYQQILTQKTSFPSIVSMLKSRGYETTAVHPFDKTFYNRNKVYPVLGFDQFISQDDIKYKDKLSSNGYISDMSAVKQVVDVLNSSNQPHFVHLVTMQNHLPILEGMNGPNSIQVSGIAQQSGKTEMESYAQSVKETDQAVKYLVDMIQQVNRPTIVVVWGDHLPALQDQTYSDHLGNKTPAQEAQFLHETPLLVAANYPLQDKNLGTLAPSFFGPLVFQLTGLQLPPYYQLLENVRKQLPGVSPNLYVDASGAASVNLTEDQKKLLHDYELVQYDLLYGKGYAKSMLN